MRFIIRNTRSMKPRMYIQPVLLALLWYSYNSNVLWNVSRDNTIASWSYKTSMSCSIINYLLPLIPSSSSFCFLLHCATLRKKWTAHRNAEMKSSIWFDFYVVLWLCVYYFYDIKNTQADHFIWNQLREIKMLRNAKNIQQWK